MYAFSLDREIKNIKATRNPRNTNWDFYNLLINVGMFPLMRSRIDSVLRLEATVALTKAIVRTFKRACSKRISREHKPL